MTMEIDGSWTLFEFVGGPRDGELCASSVADLDDVLSSYLLRSNPIHLSANPSWKEAAARAVTAFDQGTPDRYARLLWEGDSFVAPYANSMDIDGQVVSQRARIEHALIAGEHHEARLIASAFCAHTPSKTQLIESLLAPAIRAIGEQWMAGTVRTYVEQRASAIVHSILGDHSAASAHVAGLRALVATVEGEHHSLPSKMAAVALREDGWQVEEVTGPLPAHELTESVIERRLDLVVISATTTVSRDAARNLELPLEIHNIPVIIASPGQSLFELQRLARRVSLTVMAL